jgi:hypothetical protein
MGCVWWSGHDHHGRIFSNSAMLLVPNPLMTMRIAIVSIVPQQGSVVGVLGKIIQGEPAGLMVVRNADPKLDGNCKVEGYGVPAFGRGKIDITFSVRCRDLPTKRILLKHFERHGEIELEPTTPETTF